MYNANLIREWKVFIAERFPPFFKFFQKIKVEGRFQMYSTWFASVVLLGTVFTYIIMSDLTFTRLLPRIMERRTRSGGKKSSAFVLILAQPRTGSSFLGQLFNQHPDVFYLYEPLHPFAVFKKLKYIAERNYTTLTRLFLRNASICNFNGFQEYFNFLSHPGLSNPHFVLSSRSLASLPFCKYAFQPFKNLFKPLSKCSPLDANLVSLNCKSKKFVALKILTHRLPEENLKDLVEGNSVQLQKIPLKTIQLVRDPRAVVWSMIKMGLISRGSKNYTRTELNKKGRNSTFRPPNINFIPGFSFIEQVRRFCERLQKDMNLSSYLSSKLGPDQYRIIRYEDLAENIPEFSRKIFQFTGIDYAAEVKEWLRNINFDEKRDSNDELSYSTSNRNTSVTINSWRKELSLLETLIIDNQCADFMVKFSYKFIESANLLKNMAKSLRNPLRKNFHTM